MVLNNIINRIKSINSNIKFIGSFDDNNRRTGYWEEYYHGKLLRKGKYINGKKNGKWVYYVNDPYNYSFVALYKNGELLILKK
jgi:antitoxin component YwqK of YwqJK toxin-antitoxin module